MSRQTTPVLFHEIQPLRQSHARLALAMPPAAMLFIAVRQLGFRLPWTHPPMSNGNVVFLTVLLLAVYIRLITVRLFTELTPNGLSIGLRGLWRVRRLQLPTIRSARIVQYDARSDFGGYGIRSGARGMAYIAQGNRGVELELVEGGKLLIGSQRPDELAARITQAKQAAG